MSRLSLPPTGLPYHAVAVNPARRPLIFGNHLTRINPCTVQNRDIVTPLCATV